jgi:hypothetical protein
VKWLACAILVATLGATACGVEQSRVDAKAKVSINGKALSDVGTPAGTYVGAPLAATKVALIREIDIGEAIGGLSITAVTLGLACLDNHPPALCSNNSHLATTGSDGSFSFSVVGSETQGSLGVASTMEVVVRAARHLGETAGAVGIAEFSVQAASVQLPDLHVWQPGLRVETTGKSVQVDWPALPSLGYGSRPRYSLEFDDSQGKSVWVTGATQSGAPLDQRVLEDVNSFVRVIVRASSPAPTTSVDFTYLSGSVKVPNTAGVPPSRGAACAVVTTSGIGPYSATCSLTSGDSSRSFVAASAPSGAVIDLGTDRAVSLVVVRGCSARCRISLSSDLLAWSEAGSVSGEYATLPVTLNRSARYIRLVGTPSVAMLRQVSIW